MLNLYVYIVFYDDLLTASSKIQDFGDTSKVNENQYSKNSNNILPHFHKLCSIKMLLARLTIQFFF